MVIIPTVVEWHDLDESDLSGYQGSWESIPAHYFTDSKSQVAGFLQAFPDLISAMKTIAADLIISLDNIALDVTDPFYPAFVVDEVNFETPNGDHLARRYWYRFLVLHNFGL